MKKKMINAVKKTVKKYPFSSALAALYIMIFIVQGSTEVFLAGAAAAAAAGFLEYFFRFTRSIRVRRGRIRVAHSGSRSTCGSVQRQKLT